MKNKLFILLTAVLSGCKGGYEMTELYEQKILNSEQCIIEYDAWSTLNDGNKAGYTLKSSDEVISIAQAEKMPYRFLASVPSNDTIFNVELTKGEGRVPRFASSKTSQLKGMVVITDVYEYAIGGSLNVTYHFGDFTETNDSLILKRIEAQGFPLPVNGHEIGFRKGNVKLVESKEESGVLKSINIKAFVLPEYVGGLVDNLTILRNDSCKMVGQVNFTFIPTSQIGVDDFSDYGIYKKKKIVNPQSL